MHIIHGFLVVFRSHPFSLLLTAVTNQRPAALKSASCSLLGHHSLSHFLTEPHWLSHCLLNGISSENLIDSIYEIWLHYSLLLGLLKYFRSLKSFTYVQLCWFQPWLSMHLVCIVKLSVLRYGYVIRSYLFNPYWNTLFVPLQTEWGLVNDSTWLHLRYLIPFITFAFLGIRPLTTNTSTYADFSADYQCT